jgi:hypothetical protein
VLLVVVVRVKTTWLRPTGLRHVCVCPVISPLIRVKISHSIEIRPWTGCIRGFLEIIFSPPKPMDASLPLGKNLKLPSFPLANTTGYLSSLLCPG